MDNKPEEETFLGIFNNLEDEDINFVFNSTRYEYPLQPIISFNWLEDGF